MSLGELLKHLDRKRFEPHVALSRPEQAAFLRRQLHEPTDMAVIAPRASLKQARWLRPRRPRSGSGVWPLRRTLLRIAGVLDLFVVTLPYALRLRRFARDRHIAMIHQNNGFDFGAVFLA